MDEPITREEMFLAKAAGENVNIPEPITRKEQYLKKIAENGGGGSTGVGVLIVHDNTGTLDKTWQEIHDAVEANKIVLIYKITAMPDPYPDLYDVSFVTYVTLASATAYAVLAVGMNNGQMGLLPYVADSADGFPRFD